MARSTSPAVTAGALLLGSLLAACAPAPPEVHEVRPGAATPLAEVFWISGCASVLREVVGVEPSGGSMQGLELGIERDQIVRPMQCPAGVRVPGAIVTVRMTQPVAAPELRDIAFVVTYDTQPGRQTSRHVRSLRLLPAAAARPGG